MAFRTFREVARREGEQLEDTVHSCHLPSAPTASLPPGLGEGALYVDSTLNRLVFRDQNNDSVTLSPQGVDSVGLVLESRLPTIAGSILTEDTAYFVYLGQTNREVTASKVFFTVTTGGTGAQTAEVGLFSTPTAPNRANQTLTKIVATGTMGDLTGTGVLSNTNAFSQVIAAGTHLWAGIRTAMATNEPQLYGLTFDQGYGRVLSAAAAGALTGGTTFTGVVVTAGVAWQAPALTLHFA